MSKEEIDVFMNMKDIKTVFDIGAKDSPYKELRPELEYHFFEPDIKSAEKLTGLVNMWGLSDKNSFETFYEEIESFYNRGDRIDKGIVYELRTLDSYGTYADFIKIDAEGYDYKILIGGKNTIKHCKYIQFEYWEDGVQKFVDLLKEFNLFLITERNLLEQIKKESSDEKYNQLLVPITTDVIDIINKLCAFGYGGNVLAIKK